MPRVMRWLLAVLATQLAVDLAVLVWGSPSSSSLAAALEVGALLVDAAVLVMLARATELTRALIRGAAFVGMVIDAWILLGGLAYAPRGVEGVVVLASSAALVAASAFTWIVLGRDDVRTWIFWRWLRAHEPSLDRVATSS